VRRKIVKNGEKKNCKIKFHQLDASINNIKYQLSSWINYNYSFSHSNSRSFRLPLWADELNKHPRAEEINLMGKLLMKVPLKQHLGKFLARLDRCQLNKFRLNISPILPIVPDSWLPDSFWLSRTMLREKVAEILVLSPPDLRSSVIIPLWLILLNWSYDKRTQIMPLPSPGANISVNWSTKRALFWSIRKTVWHLLPFLL
jgi:hypothetical protein